MTNAVGRPPKLTDEQRIEVYKALEDYIARTPDPTIVGFVSWDEVPLKYDVTDDNINDWAEFSRLRRRATTKQEAYLIQAGGTGKFHPTMAIFRLKQPVHGYTDRQDVNQSGEVKHSYEELDDEQLERAIKARQDRVSKTA